MRLGDRFKMLLCSYRGVFPLLFVLLLAAFFWWPAMSAGYLMEDSWFLSRELSFQPWRWFLEVRDAMGYYRPVRQLFFAIPNLWSPLPDPALYHGLLLSTFLLILWLSFAFFRETGLALAPAWLATAGLGVAACWAKPLFWLSAGHNLFAACFGMAALYLRAREKRWTSGVFFFLAMASRETAIGLLLPLLWLDFSGSRRRSYDLLLPLLAALLIFLSGGTPSYVEPLTGEAPLFLLQWLKYQLAFFPGFQEGEAGPLWLALSGALSLWFFVGLGREILARKREAVYGLLFLGGLAVHLAFPLPWNVEYLGVGAAGFVAFWFSRAWKAGRFRWLAGPALLLLLFAGGFGERARMLALYSPQWEASRRWAENFAALEKGLPPHAALVIRYLDTARDEAGLRPALVFLPDYFRLLFPEREIYWDLLLQKEFAGAFGMGERSFHQALRSGRLDGKRLLHLRERDFQWEKIAEEEIPTSGPLPPGRPPSR